MRIPLEDICAGPKCRFFTNYGEATNTNWSGRECPFIYYFYDKAEMREVDIEYYETKRHFFSERQEKVKSKENMRFYHVVYEVWETVYEQNPYCSSFRSIIAKAPKRGHESDIWYAEHSYLLPMRAEGKTVGNPHSFIPVEELSKYKDVEKEWGDGSKCPSFVPYPIKEVAAL